MSDNKERAIKLLRFAARISLGWEDAGEAAGVAIDAAIKLLEGPESEPMAEDVIYHPDSYPKHHQAGKELERLNKRLDSGMDIIHQDCENCVAAIGNLKTELDSIRESIRTVMPATQIQKPKAIQVKAVKRKPKRSRK